VASVPDLFLKTGLAALKQGDYQTAITHLEAVCHDQPLPSLFRARAQMGLVVAYSKTGAIDRAFALCQTLTKSTNPQVQEWAVRIQVTLTKKAGGGGEGESIHPEELSEQFPSAPPPASALLPQQSGRARLPKNTAPPLPLSPSPSLPLFWLLQIGTAIAVFWLTRELFKFAMIFTRNLLAKLPFLEPFELLYKDPTQLLLLTLGIVLCLSPWLLDRLLRLFYGCQPLSIDTLSTQSPEAIQVLQSYCRKRSWPLPQMGVLPTTVPFALTYGNLPRTARIVVSQGLLAQLEDDEIATIYASQLGQIAHWDFVVMSLVILVTQMPYTVYRQVSQWGDHRANKILRSGATIVASLGYGLYYLLSGPAVSLSRLRIHYSDRFATEMTGNPNGLTRALLKIAIGIAKDVQQQGHTAWLLDSLNLLSPVGCQQAISLGSLPPGTQIETVLAWDCLNPNRHWLIINNTHPLMGERLQSLAHIAHHWHLATELNLVSQEPNRRVHPLREKRNSIPLSPLPPYPQRGPRQFSQRGEPPHETGAGRVPPLPLSHKEPSFLLQAAPFLGILVSFAFGGLFWLLWKIGFMLELWSLKWIYDDWTFFRGLILIGFSIGTLVRINFFFPDIKFATVQIDDLELPHLLANPCALPVLSHPVCLQGKLLGRRGISNWLGQDLILRSATGLIKLHHTSWLGPIGNLLPRQSPRPSNLVGRYLTTTGWFRRGATCWIDIDVLRTQGGTNSRSGHPIWSTLLASTAAVWGAYIIWQGG